jgi:heme-degrading monooxygenase HmoA
MAFISVTRLRLRTVRFLPAFIWRAQQSESQARKSPGNLGVELRKTKGWTFWTLTVWSSANDMAAFRRASPHREAMAKLQHWCDEAAVAHWEQDAPNLPTWNEAAEHLYASGTLPQVLYPSADHRAGRIGQ